MRKFGRKKPNREHMLRNLVTSLVLYESVDTTETKGKEVKSCFEQIIARNKENGLSQKRTVFSYFFDKNAASKVINELLPRYKDRKSGFVRSYHLKNRLGDNASMMRLELVDKKVFVEEKSVEEKTVIKEDKKTEAKSKKDAADVTVKSKK